MKATYDKNDLKSVLEYAREEYGKRILREPEEMYRVICDLAPGFSAEGEILRKLSELGMLSELERAADSQNQTEIDRAVVKIRYHLTQKMFINEEKAAFFVDTLESLYGLKVPTKFMTPSTPKQTKQSNLPIICAALLIVTIIGATIWQQWKSASDTPATNNEEMQETNHIEWTLEDGVLTISGKGPMQNYDDSFPPWKSKQFDVNIVSIVIEKGVTSIGNKAFEICRNLMYVTIPDSVTSIGVAAFHDCESLTSVTIPNSVTSIGDYAFRYCVKLTDVTIPDSVTSIGDYAFFNCVSLMSVTIPNSVTYIGDNAFYSCNKLMSVTIPDSVTYIGEWAFSSCDNLTRVSVPRKAKIAYNAFPETTKVIRRES